MHPKILLVDDREDNLLSIETILQPNGYKFVKANSGRQALKILLNEFDFAMILMDVKMPNLNGFETASLIYEREKLKHIPIIFITANNFGDENMFKGYQTGAVDYIYKPINPDVLRAKVAVLVELYKKTRLLHEQEQKLITINRSLEKEVKDRKNSEEKVIQLNRQLVQNIDSLESANKDLEQFAFMASHDLQEPLRKILMFSDRLYQKYQDVLQDDVRLINRIQSSAERMQALIVDILAFSRISIDKTNFVVSNMNEILQEILTDIYDEINTKNASITIDNLPALEVNPRLMRMLFHNLISNALKYCKKDIQPQIKIFSENNLISRSRDKRFCRIFVEDNGIGFDQKYESKIFTIFQRLNARHEFEGTGIGLALCKKIMLHHDGHITCESNPGVGTTFYIYFPGEIVLKDI